MGYLAFGNQVFKDRGFLGVGVPSYSKRIGYQPAPYPTAVGARYFLNDERSDFDDETDQAIPIAQGNKWDGGRPVYQERIYAAMKKHPDVKPKELAMVKPRVVA